MAEQILRLLGARMVAGSLLWGVGGGTVMLAASIVGCVLLARTRIVRVAFRGAGFARGVVYAWIVLAAFLGGSTLGALHGGVSGFRTLLDEPAFVASTLRPAAPPLTDGLIQAVAIEATLDPEPMIAALAPIPTAPLRRVLTDTSGVALFAGLRRVPSLQASETGRQGSAVVAMLGGLAAESQVNGALEAAGLAVPMADLAAALPSAPAATIDRDTLVRQVERVVLPRFVATWIGRGETQLLLSGASWLALALVAPVGLLWLAQGVLHLARAKVGGAPSGR